PRPRAGRLVLLRAAERRGFARFHERPRLLLRALLELRFVAAECARRARSAGAGLRVAGALGRARLFGERHPPREIVRAALGQIVGAPIAPGLAAPDGTHVLRCAAARRRARRHVAERGARTDVDDVPAVAALSAAPEVRAVAGEHPRLADRLAALRRPARIHPRHVDALAAERLALAGLERQPTPILATDLELERRVADALDLTRRARSAVGGIAEIRRLAGLAHLPLAAIVAAPKPLGTPAGPLPRHRAHRALARRGIAVVLGGARAVERPVSVVATEEVLPVAAVRSGFAGDARAENRLVARRDLELAEELLTARERDERHRDTKHPHHHPAEPTGPGCPGRHQNLP